MELQSQRKLLPPGESFSPGSPSPSTMAVLTCALRAQSVLQECVTKDLSIKYQEVDVAHAAN